MLGISSEREKIYIQFSRFKVANTREEDKKIIRKTPKQLRIS
jgi:hypothetical protein